MLDHWITKGSKQIQGKARGMIVTQSRKHCVWYFDEINRQLAERGINYRALVGFSGEVNIDAEKYTEASCNQSVDYKGNVPAGLKNPKYRLLVVANKFQTGFDEPLMQSMYVDKMLGDIQCVQTLSRLNRTTTSKTQTFVLDFVNEPENINASFQKFYKATILKGETDPNRLYDLQRQIYEFHLYTNEDVNRFCQVFYDPKRDEGSLHPLLDRVVDKFNAISDDAAKEDFRSKIQSYMRMYGYLSQIITFTDIELEKSFIFFKYLNKKLPKRQLDAFDISDAIDLDSLRIQKIHEHIEDLDSEDSIITPPILDAASVPEVEYDFLSELINQVNNKYGVSLTEEDQLDLSRLHKRMEENSDIKKYMYGDNTEDNKRNFFKKQFEDMMLSYVNERFDFYKKLDDNPSTKKLILTEMYAYYHKNHNGQGS